ncbi:type II toxin-antitoxin system Phd/YefM family antitoxin [Terracidiphilus gabretensis]|uniref:type II toxin-antitoxin system Phd/YefM family antitoxin n=1 Tax=Terracidiphilus gabretensis TaxID=1577687 RepID=UPI00071BE5D1|nr:type II toxin-antitoxin system prevent-host-death family antitoxin [Terracidiphilus gabretensis]
MEVNIHHAKTNLSQLILKAESGEEVIIARAGKPVVRLVPIETSPRSISKQGATKQLLEEKQKPSSAFFDPRLGEEIARWFSESPLLRTDETAQQETAVKKSRKHKKHKK